MLDWTTLVIGWSYVTAVLFKATALLVCAWCAHAALCGLNPRWRVLLWRATVVALAVLPVAEWALPRLEVAVAAQMVPVSAPAATEFRLPPQASIAPMHGVTRVAQRVPIKRVPPPVDTKAWVVDHFTALLGLVWAAVSLMLLLAAVRAWRNIHAIIAGSTVAPADVHSATEGVVSELGMAERVDVRIAGHLGSPFVTWIGHPVIVLPTRCLEESDMTRLKAVLAHELAHVKTQDPLWMAFARLIASLLWFHPLMWHVRSAHNSACEDVCDSVATAYLGSPDTYAKALAREALALLDTRPVPAGVPMLHGADIIDRLRKIQRGIPTNPLARHWVTASLLVGATLLALLGSMQLVHAHQPDAASSGLSSIAPSDLSDRTLREKVQNDAAECVAIRDRTGSPEIYVIARESEQLPLWREAAERGMPEGQVLLAMYHALGIGVEADPREKCRLLQAAVEQGDPTAMGYYAAALLNGDGVTQDVATAVVLFTRAATAGDRAAMWRLASLYGNGGLVEPDLPKALDWLEASANAGAPYAMFQLGQAYFSGDLGIRDEMAGRQWIAFSAEHGCPFGVDRLRQLSGHVPFTYPPEFVPPSDEASSPFGPPTESPQIDAVDPPETREVPVPEGLSDRALLAEVTADALACRECRDRAGYSKVYIQLHAAQRLPLWQEAANRGMAPGQVLLGLCYAGMVGFEKDYTKRAELFRAAAEQGEPTGMHNYASSLSRGLGVDRNRQEALEWWQKAAELGEPAAMCHLAKSYRYGQLLERDSDAALEWYLRAAEAGSAEAMYQLGNAYMGGGDMAPTNVAEGRRWLARAAEGGFPKAVAELRKTR